MEYLASEMMQYFIRTQHLGTARLAYKEIIGA